jgi:hypothetical protein
MPSADPNSKWTIMGTTPTLFQKLVIVAAWYVNEFYEYSEEELQSDDEELDNNKLYHAMDDYLLQALDIAQIVAKAGDDEPMHRPFKDASIDYFRWMDMIGSYPESDDMLVFLTRLLSEEVRRGK